MFLCSLFFLARLMHQSSCLLVSLIEVARGIRQRDVHSTRNIYNEHGYTKSNLSEESFDDGVNNLGRLLHLVLGGLQVHGYQPSFDVRGEATYTAETQSEETISVLDSQILSIEFIDRFAECRSGEDGTGSEEDFVVGESCPELHHEFRSGFGGILRMIRDVDSEPDCARGQRATQGREEMRNAPNIPPCGGTNESKVFAATHSSFSTFA